MERCENVRRALRLDVQIAAIAAPAHGDECRLTGAALHPRARYYLGTSKMKGDYGPSDTRLSSRPAGRFSPRVSRDTRLSARSTLSFWLRSHACAPTATLCPRLSISLAAPIILRRSSGFARSVLDRPHVPCPSPHHMPT